MVVAVEQQIGQSFHPQRGLVGVMPRSDRAGPHRQAAGADSSFAQNYRVRRAELARQAGQRAGREPFAAQPSRSHAVSGTSDEFSTLHGSSSVFRTTALDWPVLRDHLRDNCSTPHRRSIPPVIVMPSKISFSREDVCADTTGKPNKKCGALSAPIGLEKRLDKRSAIVGLTKSGTPSYASLLSIIKSLRL